MQQAHDFREECDVLNAVLEPLSEADFGKVTLFKDWTINHVLQHLHLFLGGMPRGQPGCFTPSFFRVRCRWLPTLLPYRHPSNDP